jgi:AraC-like DNA-binding protein
MENEKAFNELTKLIAQYAKCDGIHSTNIEGLHCYKMSALNNRLPVIYKPSIYVVAQGNKQVILDKDVFYYTQGNYLAVSVDLPLIGEVTKASQSKPYLCAQIDIDMQIMTELAIKLQTQETLPNKTEKGVFVGNIDDRLMNCILRLMQLLDTPKDIPYLSPLIIQEIHYCLLSGPHGSSIIQTYLQGSNMHRIAKIIDIMKSDIAKKASTSELAASVNMSTSSFYNQFKQVTGFSPLQYLKRLRLTQARQMMLSNNTDATNTAYIVGYESTSQFNREYARLFGLPPQREIKAFRKLITN